MTLPVFVEHPQLRGHLHYNGLLTLEISSKLLVYIRLKTLKLWFCRRNINYCISTLDIISFTTYWLLRVLRCLAIYCINYRLAVKIIIIDKSLKRFGNCYALTWIIFNHKLHQVKQRWLFILHIFTQLGIIQHVCHFFVLKRRLLEQNLK